MKVRYLVKFSKEDIIKFVGHLDLMRTIQRLLRRSGLPLEFSKGFNPHVNMSLAQPLAVGVYSSGDYMDLELSEDVDIEVVMEKLNKATPPGIKIFKAVKVKEIQNKKVFKSMAAVDAAKYSINIKYNDTTSLESEIKTLLKKENWETIKKSKTKESSVNIKLLIKKFEYAIRDNVLTINTLAACGSRQNLSPELMAKFIQNNTQGANLDAFVDIKREEMYASSKKGLIPLYEAAEEYN
ncbi:TIGR03936 family radical SAM-associated protein [Clostridium sp. JN-1]|uniref:TIGR03936 family radical SAM-associated protein n=1 Tax=Clostridium sp. JN-1 TaxID=2483110 RepID=UPI000F0BC12F|nr:TIGR03936 family radical SAM-associated protein [Clostridium sp. JN-1]